MPVTSIAGWVALVAAVVLSVSSTVDAKGSGGAVKVGAWVCGACTQGRK